MTIQMIQSKIAMKAVYQAHQSVPIPSLTSRKISQLSNTRKDTWWESAVMIPITRKVSNFILVSHGGGGLRSVELRSCFSFVLFSVSVWNFVCELSDSATFIEGCCEYFSAPFGKRSWKMFYCTLRDPLVMYLHKDERGFHKNQVRFVAATKVKCLQFLSSSALWQRSQCHQNSSRTGNESQRLHQKAACLPAANFRSIGIPFPDERFQGTSVVDWYNQLRLCLILGATTWRWIKLLKDS